MMNAADTKFSDLIGRLKTELRQDKKRTTMLVVLLVVGGIVAGRLVVGKGSPKKATAAKVAPQTSGPGKTFSETPQSPRKYQRVDTSSIDRNITRDLFWPDTRCFPSVESNDAAEDAARQEKTDHAQKLAEAQQRERLKRAAHIKSIRVKADGLCLTSTMLGNSPTALINGRVLRTGDLIDGFRIKSISSDSCVVVMEDVDVKLKMRE